MTGIYYMKDFGLSGMLLPIVTIFSQWFWFGTFSGCRKFDFDLKPKMKILSHFFLNFMLFQTFMLLVSQRSTNSESIQQIFMQLFSTQDYVG